MHHVNAEKDALSVAKEPGMVVRKKNGAETKRRDLPCFLMGSQLTSTINSDLFTRCGILRKRVTSLHPAPGSKTKNLVDHATSRENSFATRGLQSALATVGAQGSSGSLVGPLRAARFSAG